MLNTVRRAFDRWVLAQDDFTQRVAADQGPWVALDVFVLAILAGAAYAPGARALFQLQFLPALLCFLPISLTAHATAWAMRGQESLGRRYWLLVLGVGIFGLQFFAASLVAWSSTLGGVIFAGFFLLSAAYHGYAHRSTLDTPLPTFATFLATLAAVALCQTPEQRVVLTFAGGAGTFASVLLGRVSAHADQRRRNEEQLRAAVQAQMVAEAEQRVRALSSTLVDVLGAGHDINNLLMACETATEALRELHTAERAPGREEVREILSDLEIALSHLKGLAGLLGDRAQTLRSPEMEATAVAEAIAAVRPALQRRYPGVQIVVSAPKDPALTLMAAGGASTLRRILENLVINACEGNGARGASRVTVTAERDPSGARIELRIEDNGPGFSPDSLDKPIRGFATTKAQGTGLGLYTVERLVIASGGRLTRANRAEGGAVVRVLLPEVST